MAYKRSNGKLQRMRKVQPAVETFILTTDSTPANTQRSFYADLSQIASIANRRFYRQGINWMVAGIKIVTAAAGSVTIRKLPNTWVMKNAWTKSFAHWQEMNNKALAQTDSVRPKFLDFKIYADKDHHNLGFDANLLPITYDLDQPIGPAQIIDAVPGEWVSSKVHIPIATAADPTATADRELIAVGASYPGASLATGLNAVSLIEGYAASRSLPNIKDPNAPGDADDTSDNTPENWIAALSNEGTDQSTEVLEEMLDSNNIAPYPFEGDGINGDTMYPGGANQMGQLQVHDLLLVTNTTVGGMTYGKGGQFPCGLIRFDHQAGDTAANLLIQVDLVPGNHRGYMCEKMGA